MQGVFKQSLTRGSIDAAVEDEKLAIKCNRLYEPANEPD